MTDASSSEGRLHALQEELDRLGRLLSIGAVMAFERIGDDDALLGPASLWSPLGFAPGELPLTRSALIGQLHPGDQADAAPKVAQAADDDVLLGRLRLRDGSHRYFRQRTRVDRLHGDVVRIACILTPIDNGVAAADATEGNAERLRGPRRGDETALGFVARASHEIRTPLNGVLGLVELSRRLAVSDSQLRLLEMAAESGRALTRVVNGVLDLASLDRTHAAPNPEWIELDDLLSEALRSVTPQMGWGEFAVVYDYDSDAARVRVDRGYLRQVLVNLLGNATKLTRQGHVGLSARVHCVQGLRCEVTLLIEDTGPGIPADQLPRLFEPFGMAERAKRQGGTGLGLSIVKALVSALQGSISVQSSVGVGTRFELRLHLDAEPEPKKAAGPVPVGGHAWLIYAPPHLTAGEWLCRRLRRLGWSAEMLPSVVAALERAKGARPDLVMLAAHSVQSADDISALAAALPDARQVLLSRADWDRPQIEQRAVDVGTRCVLVPVAHRDLLAIVAADATLVTTLPDRSNDQVLAGLHGHVLLVDDDEVNRIVGEQILCHLHLGVLSVATGEAALDACRAKPPDAVLMDVQMPGMGGLEACRRIGSDQQRGLLPPFPVIGLTADSTPATAADCLAAGMSAVLTKPYSVETLHRELARWLTTR
jgi:signal transduction histidine kinase/CheY-like chemotaxis protein